MSGCVWLLIAALTSALLLVAPASAPAGSGVTLTVPTPAAGTVSVVATASPARLTRIAILVDGAEVASCSKTPCTYAWDTTSVANGSHKVVARAFKLYSVVKKQTTVTVNNTVPTPTEPLVPVPAPSPEGDDAALDLLVRPFTLVGSTDPLVAAYDAAQVTMAAQYADEFPATPGDLTSSNYYDFALVLYTLYLRTGNPAWRDSARTVARIWRDSPENASIEPYLAGNWSLGSSVPPPRGLATLGLAVLALEDDDAKARQLVHLQARLMEQRWVWSTGDYGLSNPVMPMGDAREAGYGLMALVASTLLGEDHRASAKQLLDAILARQKSSGEWQSWEEPSTIFTYNFMNGVLMEALVLYDRAIGDARIVPALERAIAWTWSTQWMAADQAFRYDAGGSEPAPVLNGLMLPAWGHVYARTGNTAYRDQGQAIFKGLVEVGLNEIWSVKQFDQVYRSSGRYLGDVN